MSWILLEPPIRQQHTEVNLMNVWITEDSLGLLEHVFHFTSGYETVLVIWIWIFKTHTDLFSVCLSISF